MSENQNQKKEKIYDIAVKNEEHKSTGNEMKVYTIRKKDKSKMNTTNLNNLVRELKKRNQGKKIMIKALNQFQYFTIKGFNEELGENMLLDDDDYFNGKGKSSSGIYKCSIYFL